jgi:hypothetical protein
MRLVPGKGDEQDTLKDKTIYVYDTQQFPFYPGPLSPRISPAPRALPRPCCAEPLVRRPRSPRAPPASRSS